MSRGRALDRSSGYDDRDYDRPGFRGWRRGTKPALTDPRGAGRAGGRRPSGRTPPSRSRSPSSSSASSSASTSILIPALIGVGLVYVSLSFLSSRLNPFSLSFYLTVKPSWLSIGTLAFVGLILVGVAYGYYTSGLGPLAPGVPHFP